MPEVKNQLTDAGPAKQEKTMKTIPSCKNGIMNYQTPAEGLGITKKTIAPYLKNNLVYDRTDIDWYAKFNRFGCMDPYNNLTQTKEYIFFVKPDCHIVTPNTMNLQPALANNAFFQELMDRYPNVIQSLQMSAGTTDNKYISSSPFMNVLSNAVNTTIDFEGLSASEMDNSTDAWGTTMPYRKDAWTGDQNISFSLEFEDTKYLEIYMMAKAYEEYERLKTIGKIYPPYTGDAVYSDYIKNKRLHDVFGIYRFIVGEDYTDIVYYSYICGAYFANVPRDAFNDLKNGSGLTYSLDFKAFCVMDMDPRIIINFNNLVLKYYGSDFIVNEHWLPIIGTYDSKVTDCTVHVGDGKEATKVIDGDVSRGVNSDWAICPFINIYTPDDRKNAWLSSEGMKRKYELLWYA